MPATLATTTSKPRRAARRRRKAPGGVRLARATRGHSRPATATDFQLCLLSALEMRKLTLLPTAEIGDLCSRCVEEGSKGCPACTQRRRKAVRLHEAGQDVAAIAEAMELSVERVQRLLEQHYDRLEERAFSISHIENAPLRALFERRKAQDPDFSAAELARRADLSCSSHVERELGLIATSTTVKNGVEYPGRIKSTISIVNAEKLLAGMGYGPRDIERLIAGEELV